MSVLAALSSKAVCRIIGGASDATLARFPPIVRIETTNACNARCVICPHHRIQRPIGRMDDKLFVRVIDECSGHSCREVHLHNFGEPLLDPSLEDRVRYAKQKGIGKVKLFTNGSLLSERRARGLVDAGLDEIKISFDGATPEEFQRIRRPLKFHVVAENTRRLVALRDQAGSRLRIHVACCSTSDKDRTMEAIEAMVDGFSFGKIHNWTGHGDESPRGGLRKPCSRLWQTFTILVTGEVALCCLDYDGQHLLGRVDHGSSIADVWTGGAYRAVRRMHKAGRQAEIPLCARCTKSFLAVPLRRKAA